MRSASSAVRAAVGAKNLTGIVVPSILSTASACVAAIIAAKLLARSGLFQPERYSVEAGERKPAKPDADKALEAAEALARIERPRPGRADDRLRRPDARRHDVLAVARLARRGRVEQQSARRPGTEVRLVADLADDPQDQVDGRLHHGREGARHDERDCQFDKVAAQDEVLEASHERFPFRDPTGSGAVARR